MTDSLTQKLWSYYDTLRDDGVSYGDYVEQLTFLLFLKMAREYNKPPHNRDIKIPKAFNWESLLDKTSLDIFWLKDDSLSDLENLPDPDELALEIVENLEAGLASFREIVETLNNE